MNTKYFKVNRHRPGASSGCTLCRSFGGVDQNVNKRYLLELGFFEALASIVDQPASLKVHHHRVKSVFLRRSSVFECLPDQVELRQDPSQERFLQKLGSEDQTSFVSLS